MRVRRLHAKLFYRPLLESVARMDKDALRLSPDAAVRQLAALGYAAPENALGHLKALTGGGLAQGPDPGAAAADPARMAR